MERMQKGLESFKLKTTEPIRNFLLNPRVEQSQDELTVKQKEVIQAESKLLNNPKNCIKKQLQYILLHSVQGPLGTGKTHFIIHLVKYWLETNKDSKILVCAPTNLAMQGSI